MLVMGVLFEYFSAISNDVAASVIDRPGGPASSTGAPSETPPHVAFDVVATKGIDPVVQLGNLEALLTERPFDDVRASPRSGALVDIRDDGELLVLAVTDELTAALAAADTAKLAEVAAPWSQTEEFYGRADPEDLVPFLVALAGLARRATAQGFALYCWVCV